MICKKISNVYENTFFLTELSWFKKIRPLLVHGAGAETDEVS